MSKKYAWQKSDPWVAGVNVDCDGKKVGLLATFEGKHTLGPV